MFSASFKNSIFKVAIIALPLCGLWYVGQGAYIHTKAVLAQFLLETAWSETLRGQKEVKPWPWADTWPVARLSAPQLGISRIVLAGASGSSLAFGPGHLFGSAAPGSIGNVIISGHRDTHFSFLEKLKKEDILIIESSEATSMYKVTDLKIVDTEKVKHIPTDSSNRLLLLTCYPFNAIQAGGPLRYVVIAKPYFPNTMS